MMSWTEVAAEMQRLLHLKTDPLAFRRLEKLEDLDKIKNVFRLPYLSTFCQALFMARINGLTVGITAADKLFDRCMRIHGLRATTEETMKEEANMLSTTWFASPEEALKQQLDYPRLPLADAIVVAPLSKQKFEPEVILIFGNPAQMTMIMCGLQKEKYERFQFFFIGEGACADALAQCYNSGKPALAIPCYGERAIGQVADDELVIALPPGEIERAVSGMQKLHKVGFRYPIAFIGGQTDIEPIMSQIYPMAFKRRPE